MFIVSATEEDDECEEYIPGEVINAKDVLELGRKRETANESSSGDGSGGGSGNVAKQSSLDDESNQASRATMSYDHSISSANPLSMEIESSSSSVAKDVERSVATPIHYSNVEAVDMQGSGDGVSNETELHQHMAAVALHSENQIGSEHIMPMEQQQQQQQILHDNNRQATSNQDSSHNVPLPQSLIAHHNSNNNNNNNGQSIITHNDQNAANSSMAASQSIISPNEQFRAHEQPSKNFYSF